MEGTWHSRRSPVYSRRGMAASSQVLTHQLVSFMHSLWSLIFSSILRCYLKEAALSILKQGGNAADAAIACAAALNVTQPCSTGIGGDAFCLFYDAKTKRVHGLNGSGRAPSLLSIPALAKRGIEGQMSSFDVNTVTVPGAAAAWVDTVEHFGSGKLTLSAILQPAINLAEDGYPVAPLSARWWHGGLQQLQRNGKRSLEMLMPNGKAPEAGEIMRLPNMAKIFRLLGTHGKAGFYSGEVSRAIVDLIAAESGVMTLEDLANHQSEFVEPISTEYRGVRVWEIPPNGQGIVALMSLNMLSNFDLAKVKNASQVQYYHHLIEAVRFSFADARHYVADQQKSKVPVSALLSPAYTRQRLGLFSADRSNRTISLGYPEAQSGTVYFCIVDGMGNACSFINSNYMGFGTGLIPQGCGFTLQNRGHNFSLDTKSPNALEGGKRPYHTIIPGMATTKTGDLHCVFGVMGGWMQPQGHVQVMSNMLDLGMNPQQALDAPRFCIADGMHNGQVLLEEGFTQETIKALAAMQHEVELTPQCGNDRAVFGVGQIITRDPTSGALCAGSDPRGDGCAQGY